MLNGALNDVASQYRSFVGNTPASTSSGANAGTAVDTLLAGQQPVDGRMALIGMCGATTGTVAFQVSESDTSGGSYTDITGALLSFSATADDTVQQISFTRTKRWLKVTQTNGANTTLGSSLLLGEYKDVN
jgi:hypothetical protein